MYHYPINSEDGQRNNYSVRQFIIHTSLLYTRETAGKQFRLHL